MTTNPTLLNNRYRLEARLGKGGMAVVFRGIDLMLERPVAIKVLRPDYSQDPRFRERFRQEAKAAANLSHPNIVTVHDFGFDADRLFIVMEYIPGTDLKTIIQDRGRFTVDEAMRLAIQACAGIGYAHRAGLVHCDVKPHNMLVTPDNRLKVTDFGIARALASIRPDEQSNVVWGSPQYFSPEQASGGPPMPASDVYSLGVVLYEMLTGRLPFDGETGAELSRQHQLSEPEPPRTIVPDLPESLDHIVMKVLSKEPSARYRTADQLGRVLMTFSEQSGPLTPVNKPASGNYGRPPSQPARVPRPTAGPTPARPTSNAAPRPPVPKPVEDAKPDDEPEIFQVDWLGVLLGLVALIAVGGLVPFWVWVYFVYNPPVP